MAQKRAKLAIMFADISGSTRLYEVMGDQKARSAIADCMRAVFSIIHDRKGKIIKTIGDEVMCVFIEVAKAAEAAGAIHERLNQSMFGDQNLSMRIGFHYGISIIEGKDVFGDAVNVAARMVTQAKSNQTILSKSTMELLPVRLRETCRFTDTAPIKGKKEDIQIYELLWQQEDVTHMVIPAAKRIQQSGQGAASLYVRYHQESRKLDREHSSLLMGRGKSCDLPVHEDLASRYHVRIELRRDKFFIIDQSTNGTYVRSNGGTETFLRREEMPLLGRGEISLGRKFEENPTELVAFSSGKPL